MKKNRLIFTLLAITLLLMLRVFAVGGSADDPLVSLRYLNGSFLEHLQSMMQEWAKEDTQSLYQEAEQKLHALGEAYLEEEQETDWSYSAHYEPLSLKRGDTVTLSGGSGLTWINGRGYAEAGLVDVTMGTESAAQTEFICNHRYLSVTESSTGVVVTVLSDAANLLVEGCWSLTESGESPTQFIDLTKTKDWFYDAVAFAVEQGLFQGTSANQFSPLANMDRSMLAVVLHRLAGQPATGYSGMFSDIADEIWYTEGVEWAGSAGIVAGSGDGTFRPFDFITRQEIALMLYRYADGYLKLDVSQRGNLEAFSDAETVSSWAKEAVSWAVGAGIIAGSDLGALNPQANASRAEVATMLQRLSHWISLTNQTA